MFRRGINSIEFCRTRNAGPSPWIVFTSPQLFPEYPINITQFSDVKPETAIALELSVLLIQPQPNWSLLLKVSIHLVFTIIIVEVYLNIILGAANV